MYIQILSVQAYKQDNSVFTYKSAIGGSRSTIKPFIYIHNFKTPLFIRLTLPYPLLT